MSSKGSFKDGIKTNDQLLYRETTKFVKALKNFDQVLRGLERNSEIEIERLKADQFIDTLRRWMNPVTYYKREFAQFNSNCSISDQIMFNNPILDYKGIEREGVKSRTLTLKTAPNFAYPGGMAYFTKLDFPYRLSLNFSFPSPAKVSRFFEAKFISTR